MEAVFVLTHLVMTICVGIIIFSIIPRGDEEKTLKKAVIPKHVVAIFKTDIKNKRLAKRVLRALYSGSPDCCFNVDLNNKDRILRVQSDNYGVEIERIIQIGTAQSVQISLSEN
jgi:hypothetical protein